VERTNGIHWAYEKELAGKFNPCLILPGYSDYYSYYNDHGVSPKPVEIIKPNVNDLWVRVYNLNGQFVNTLQYKDLKNGVEDLYYKDGSNVIHLNLTKFNAGNYTVLKDNLSKHLILKMYGRPPDCVRSEYLLYFHMDWAGPDGESGTYDQPNGWYDAYNYGHNGYGPGSNYPTTTYAHLFINESGC